MYDDSVEKKYEKAFEQVGYLQPGFAANAKREMAQMVEVIAKGNKNIYAELATGRGVFQKGGFIAEEFHAETFNLDAVLKGDGSRAYTDKYTEWKQQEWHGRPLVDRDTTDVVIAKDGRVEKSYQSKFLKDAHDSAGALSDPKYSDNDGSLAPSDQIDGIKQQSRENIKINLQRDGDPVRRENYQRVRDTVTDKVSNKKSSSTSLTKEEANQLGSGDISKLKDIERRYQTKSTLKQMGNAAVGAAALSAVVSGSMNTVRYIQLAREGRLTAAEATIKIVSETVAAAADSAVKASANAGVQSLMVRYGSEKVAMEVLAKQGLKSMMKSNAVTVGVVCAVDAVKDLVLLGMGNLTKEEFFEHQGKGLMTTSSGVVGGSLGMAGATSVASVLGAASGSLAMTAASLVGALSGGMIAGLAMSLAIENGIEKSYRDLVSNTVTLHAAARELDSVSRAALQTQTFFLQYLQADADLEEALQDQFDRIDQAGAHALDAINRI